MASQDIQTSSGYLISKGVEIVVHIFDLHPNSDVYTDYEHFDPERFLTEKVVNRRLSAYLPFSGGPRHCIGKQENNIYTNFRSNFKTFRPEICHGGNENIFKRNIGGIYSRTS